MRYPVIVVFLITVLVFPTVCKAQSKDLTMSGIVTDNHSRLPVEGARITVIGNLAKSDTTTDIDGLFIVDFTKGIEEGSSVRIRVEKSGYMPYEKLVAVSSTITLQVSLLTITINPEPKPKTGPKPPAAPQAPKVSAELTFEGKNITIDI